MDARARLDALQNVLAALAHPARRQILMTIHFRGEMSAGDVARRFACAWPTTTRHLNVLAKAGLVRVEKAGRRRVYRVDKQRLSIASDWLGWFDKDPTPRLGKA